MEDGKYEYTIYTGGFSSATNTYYMSLYEDPAIKPYPMSAVDLDSSTFIPSRNCKTTTRKQHLQVSNDRVVCHLYQERSS